MPWLLARVYIHAIVCSLLSKEMDSILINIDTTGLCHLKCLRLTSTCVGAYARSSGFGVMVEVPQNKGAAKGPLNHHKHHEEDKNHNDNSGMFLCFSTNDGATYYNTEDPSRTIPLDRSSSRRMFWGWSNPDPGDCTPALGKFGRYSTVTLSEIYNFETCFNSTRGMCWTKSHSCDSYSPPVSYPCVPNGYEEERGDDNVNMIERNNQMCGNACQGQHEDMGLLPIVG